MLGIFDTELQKSDKLLFFQNLLSVESGSRPFIRSKVINFKSHSISGFPLYNYVRELYQWGSLGIKLFSYL